MFWLERLTTSDAESLQFWVYPPHVVNRAGVFTISNFWEVRDIELFSISADHLGVRIIILGWSKYWLLPWIIGGYLQSSVRMFVLYRKLFGDWLLPAGRLHTSGVTTSFL